MASVSHEEKRLQEIRNFEESLQDGFELYTTGKSAIEYHFGSRSLKDVFETSFSSEELRNECIDLAERLFFIIERDISKHMKRQMEKGLQRQEAKLFVRRIGVFGQLLPLQDVNGLLSDELKQKMNAFLTAIDQSLVHFKYKTELQSLSGDFIASFRNLSLSDACTSSGQQSRLAQLDASIYSADCSAAPDGDPHEMMSTHVANHAGKLLNGLMEGDVQKEELIRLCESDCILKQTDTTELLKRLASVWWQLVEAKSLPVQQGALRLLRFLLLSATDRDEVVRTVHEMYTQGNRGLPALTRTALLPEGKRAITTVINEMGSHDEMQRDAVKCDRVLAEFQWLALVSPEDTISALLQRCFIDRRIVAPSVRLLSSLPSLSCLTSPTASSSASSGLIMTSLLSIARSTEYSIPEEREALVYLIASLTRQKKNGKDHAVVSTEHVFKVFVTDSIASSNEDKLAVALSLLIRLFSTGESKHSKMKFTTAVGERADKEIESAELALFLIDTIGSTEQDGNTTVFELAKKTLKQMGSKMREDGIVWSAETSEFILSRLSSHQWYVKVAVTQWFSSVLGEPKRQIPSGLLLCLSAEQTHLFDQIVVPFDFSPVECFLRSLYEVALWDLPFALSFLDLGVTVPPADDNMPAKLSIAIVDVAAATRAAHWQSLQPLYPLTQRLVNVLDVAFDCRLERLNRAIYHSVENQRALNILARATKLAFITREEGEGRDSDWALLQLFCSVARQYIDGEMDGWRKFQRMKAKDDFNGCASLPSDASIERLSSTEYVLTQCSTLFPLVVSLTHIVPKVPPCLQVLLATVSGYLAEFYARPPSHLLDAAPTGSVPDTTVYAYAKNATRASGNSEERIEHSATNQLFDVNGRDRSIGTARAINDAVMAQMIESKLSATEEDKKPQPANGYAAAAQSNGGSSKRRNRNGRRK